MESLINSIPTILEKASSGLYGVLALVAIVFAAVAFILFRNAEQKQKEKVFMITTFFLLAIVFSALIAGIAKERDPLLVNNNTLGGHVTVDANAGLQNSGIYLEGDQKVVLEPEGRIHLASEQIDNFIELTRYFIAQNLPDEKVPDQDRDYKSPPVNTLLEKYKTEKILSPKLDWPRWRKHSKCIPSRSVQTPQ